MPLRPKEKKPRVHTQDDEPATGCFSLARYQKLASEADLAAAEGGKKALVFSLNVYDGENVVDT